MNKNKIGEDCFVEIIENLDDYEYPYCWVNRNCNGREDQP